MPEEKKEKTIEDLTKDFEEYKKMNEKKMKDLEDKHKIEVDELKSKLLDKELTTGIDIEKEEIPEDEKVVTWNDIKDKLEEY